MLADDRNKSLEIHMWIMRGNDFSILFSHIIILNDIMFPLLNNIAEF